MPARDFHVFLAFALSALMASAAIAQTTDSDSAGEGAALLQYHKEKAELQLEQEEHQRILGVLPNFNTSNVEDAEPLSPEQKVQLAIKSSLDPATVAVAGLDAGLASAQNSFPGYGHGSRGFMKRFGASYADTFNGSLLGNALFPVLLHQDPRYFRKGTGSFTSRLFYSALSTVRCKTDEGRWAVNYSNIFGNLAAGGLSNLYYPATDRGAGLTLERGLTVSAEGTLGAVFIEFWPDLNRKLFHRHRSESAAILAN